MVRERIRASCERVGRDPEEVKLCAVTKNRNLREVQALTQAGHFYIGENRVQEAEQKLPYLPEEVTCDFIGHLQSNKASMAVQMFQSIHSVDRKKIIQKLQQQCDKRGLEISVYLQVNISGEDRKHGVSPDTVSEHVDSIRETSSLTLVGLMAMAPYMEDPEETRPYFQRMKEMKCAEEERHSFPSGSLGLSMGMSQDFHVAVEEGATIVRVGSRIFS